MKKLISIASILVCVLLGLVRTSCDVSPQEIEPKASKIEDLNSPDFNVCMALGAASMSTCEEKLPKARHGYFISHHTAYEALRRKKIDAYVFDSHTLDYMAAISSDFAVLPGSLGSVEIAIGISPARRELLEPINAFIDHYQESGLYTEMYNRWIKRHGAEQADMELSQKMPQIEAPAAPKRKLVVGICSQLEPMCYRKVSETGSELIGFDMELLRRLALHLNVRYELRDLDYATMMQMLAKGELDIVVAGLNRTAEREASILFSKNYINARIVALVRTTTKSDKPEYVVPQQ